MVLSDIFVDEMLSPWIEINIHIALKLSKLDKFNSETMLLKNMVISRYNFKNALEYFDFQNKCLIISNFNELKKI